MAGGVIVPKKSPEMYEAILSLTAQGLLLKDVCNALDLDRRTVYDWRRDDPDFGRRYEEAQLQGYDAMAEEVAAVANGNHRSALIENKDNLPEHVVSKKIRALAVIGDPVARDKLIVDTRLKLLAAWHSQKYGQKQAVDLNANMVVEDNRPDPIAVTSAIVQALRGAKRDGKVIDVEPRVIDAPDGSTEGLSDNELAANPGDFI